MDDLSVYIAVLSFVTSIISTIISTQGANRIARISRSIELDKMRMEKEKLINLYKEPLFKSAADLQSRIYNILNSGFLGYYIYGTERQKAYSIDNTVFLFAQFFAWTEAIRNEIQFISLDDEAKTRELSRLQNKVYSLMQSDKQSPLLMVFAGEQRAMGEKMLKIDISKVRCIGYNEYIESNIQDTHVLFKAFANDVKSLAEDPKKAYERLKSVQHALIALLFFLDPEYLRFPKEQRTEVL